MLAARIAQRQSKLGTLEVTGVEPTAATCRIVSKNDGVELAKEMKVKAMVGK